MKITAKIITFVLVANVCFGQSEIDPFEPRVEFGKDKDLTTFEPPSPSDWTDKKIIKETLYGFPKGKFSHSNMMTFCSNIVAQIDEYRVEGYEIVEISVKGFADGNVNKGVENWSLVPEKECKWKSVGKIYDDGLAYVRGCLTKEFLFNLLDQRLFSLQTENLDKYDEPDFGNRGGTYRRTEIVIIMDAQ